MKKEECNCGCCNNQFGIMSVIFSLVGVSLILLPILGMLVGILLSILGIIFGIVQYRRARNSWAIWGIVLGAIGIIGDIIVYKVIMHWAQNIAQQVIAQQQAAGSSGTSLPSFPAASTA